MFGARYEKKLSNNLNFFLKISTGVWFGLFGLVNLSEVARRYAALDGADLAASTDLLSKLTLSAFLLLIAGCAFLSHPAVAGIESVYARSVAVGGTVATMLLVIFPHRDLPISLSLLSTALIMSSNILAIYVLAHLGRSFSILPQARSLVARGPYAWVRHPLYLAEELAVLGVFLQYASLGSLAVLILHALLQIERMRLEERVLGASFPDYADYAARTARLVPGVY